MDLVKFDCYRKLAQWYHELKEILSSFVDSNDSAASLTQKTDISKKLWNEWHSIIPTYTELGHSKRIHGKKILLNKDAENRNQGVFVSFKQSFL